MDKKEKLTISDIEGMTPHEIAELLTNIVLVLKRLPNEPFSDLQRRAEQLAAEEEED